MRELRRALMVWAVLMGLFLLVIIWVNRYGDRAVKAIEMRMKLTQGLKLESSNMLDEAIRNYRDVLETNEQAFQPRALLVGAYVKAGKLSDALSEAARAVDVAPAGQKLQGLLLLGRVCLEMGLWDKAKGAAEWAVGESPTCGEAHYIVAKAAEAMRAYPRMVEELDKVAELGPKGSSTEYEEARSRRRKEAAEYEAGIRQRGGSPELYYKLGMLYKEQGRWRDAIETIMKAANSGQAYADAVFWLGVQAEVTGDLDGAIAEYRKVVDSCANHLDGLLNLERCLLLRKLDEQPGDAYAWYTLGQLNSRFRNRREAARNFAKAVEHDPNLADAHFRLGYALQGLGRLEDARAAYVEAVRLSPTHLRAHHGLQRLQPQP